MNSGIACVFVLETAETMPMPMYNDKIWRLRRQTEQTELGPFGQSWSTIP